jgi:hypothetical protein
MATLIFSDHPGVFRIEHLFDTLFMAGVGTCYFSFAFFNSDLKNEREVGWNEMPACPRMTIVGAR